MNRNTEDFCAQINSLIFSTEYIKVNRNLGYETARADIRLFYFVPAVLNWSLLDFFNIRHFS